jgi:hypothetical protein
MAAAIVEAGQGRNEVLPDLEGSVNGCPSVARLFGKARRF